MKVYTKTELKIEWQEADALELSRVWERMRILRDIHNIGEMASVETGAVITSNDLENAMYVIGLLLSEDAWYASFEG